jgi:hypothetical protein
MRLGSRSVAVLVALLLLVPLGPTRAATPVGVRTTPADEIDGVAADGYLGWVQNSRAHPARFNAYVKPDGNQKFRVNARGTKGAMGSIQNDTLVYQQWRKDYRAFVERGRGISEIRFFDLLTRQRSNAPAGVNTRRWEYWPRVSGDWLLFGRIGRRSTQILLRNMVTGETRQLLKTSSHKRALPGPGQVAGNFAVWDDCNRRRTSCNVFRYDIAAETTTRLPKPSAVEWQGFPSVTTDGTVYFTRSGPSCSERTSLVRFPVGGPATVLLRLQRRGWEIDRTYAYEAPAGDVHVYYPKYNACGRGDADIFKIID